MVGPSASAAPVTSTAGRCSGSGMRWSSFAVVLAGVAELVACGGGSGGAVAHEAPVLSVWEFPPPTGMWGSMGLSWTAPAGRSIRSPGVVLDPQGNPHAFYGGPIPSAASPDMSLLHAWHDGGGWRTEEVLRRPDVSVTTFGVGADGVLRAAFADYWARSLELVSASAGGWTTEDLGVHLPASTAWSPPLVTADAAGNPSLIVCQDPNSCIPRNLWRDDAGWHAELVPLDDGGAMLGFIRPLALTPGPLPRLALSYAKLAPGSPTRLVTVERGPSGWGPLQPLGDAAGASVGAVSADGASLIVATGSSQGGPAKAWVVDASGTRTVDWFRPSGAPFTAGIGPEGKGWILAWVTRYAAGEPPPPVVVFEER